MSDDDSLDALCNQMTYLVVKEHSDTEEVARLYAYRDRVLQVLYNPDTTENANNLKNEVQVLFDLYIKFVNILIDNWTLDRKSAESIRRTPEYKILETIDMLTAVKASMTPYNFLHEAHSIIEYIIYTIENRDSLQFPE
jgi:hypothetical protein